MPRTQAYRNEGAKTVRVHESTCCRTHAPGLQHRHTATSFKSEFVLLLSTLRMLQLLHATDDDSCTARSPPITTITINKHVSTFLNLASAFTCSVCKEGRHSNYPSPVKHIWRQVTAELLVRAAGRPCGPVAVCAWPTE